MPVRTELSGPAAWFVIDDPPTRSAISRATAEQIRDVLARAEAGAAVATWVKTGENPAAARRAGGKRGGMQGPCGCAARIAGVHH